MQLSKYTQATLRFIAFSFILICSSCSKDKHDSLPASLQKLTEQTDCTCNPFLNECRLNGNTVYVFSCGGPACDCVATYYNAKGEEFQLQTGDHIDFVKQVWLCKE